jgi:hypothetical protein
MGPPQYVVMGRRYATRWLTVPLIRLNPLTGEIKTEGSVDWDQTIAGSGPGDNPFMSGGFATIANGRFITGRSDRQELRWYDTNGTVRQVTRWRERPEPVSKAMISVWERRMRAAFKRVGLSQPDIENRISGMKKRIQEPVPFFGNPGPAPDYGGLITDPNGNVWIAAFPTQGRDAPRRYYVMSPEGTWLGYADTPARFRVLAINKDRLLGVERDSLDVQAVSLYTYKPPHR